MISVIELILKFLAPSLVLVSFLMKGEKKIRFVNLFGAIAWITYGSIFLKDASTVVMNGALAGVQLYNLIKFYMEEKKNG